LKRPLPFDFGPAVLRPVTLSTPGKPFCPPPLLLAAARMVLSGIHQVGGPHTSGRGILPAHRRGRVSRLIDAGLCLRMNIRTATSDDLDLLLSLGERRAAELSPPPHPPHPPAVERARVESVVADGVALIAEENGRAIGYALARQGDRGPTAVHVSDLWTDPAVREPGAAHELLRRVGSEALARGGTHLLLDVDSRSRSALGFYERLGFEEAARTLRIGVEAFLQEHEQPAESIGALHVQSDDAPAVERAVAEYLPRVLRGASSQVDPGRGWTAVRIAPFDLDALRKLGAELSHRFGVTVLLTLEEKTVVRFVIHDRGRMVDEYLSVPEYFGPLPLGDAAALRANPTVVSRLTGAPAASVRAAAPIGDSPGDLPPADELYAGIAEVMGLEP
jgi:ribosomal protein S18 acetylase RimI-like enzyme